MTTALEHATLTDVDDLIRHELEEAAEAVDRGPARLKAAILAAADAGERPADITRAIRHVYTYDYVAKLIREQKRRRAAQT